MTTDNRQNVNKNLEALYKLLMPESKMIILTDEDDITDAYRALHPERKPFKKAADVQRGKILDVDFDKRCRN